MPSLDRRLVLGLSAAALGIAGLVSLYMRGPDQGGVRVLPKADRRDFNLRDTSGKAVSLAAYQGKWLLLFFGYTHCPDVCPTTLVNIADTLKALGERAKAYQPIFITIDPERDTPEAMSDYLANFDGGFVGLTGTPDQVAAAAKAYGVFYRRQPTAGGDDMMDHSTAIALVSPRGNFLRVFRPDDAPEAFAAELISYTHEAQEAGL